MKLTAAIDAYIEDMRLQGRINSPATERDYRGALMAHAEDVANRDPRYTSREDVKRTLARWAHPNSRGKAALDLRFLLRLASRGRATAA